MDFPLLAGLDDSDRRQLLINARRRKFGRREIIFHEGDPGESVYLVNSGHIGIRMTNPMGDVAMVRVVCPGEFFGELALLSPGPRSATAFSLEAAETLTISRGDFDALRNRSSSSENTLVTALALEVRRLAGALTEALYLPADKRFYRRLLEVAQAYSPQAPADVPLTQDELAQLSGMTRPTANQLLKAAEAAGAITVSRGRVTVADYSWLERKGR